MCVIIVIQKVLLQRGTYDECPKTLITYSGFSVFVFNFAFKDCYFVMLLIFSFMFDFVGKVVQLKAYWRIEERNFTTLLQRHDVEVNDAV